MKHTNFTNYNKKYQGKLPLVLVKSYPTKENGGRQRQLTLGVHTKTRTDG